MLLLLPKLEMTDSCSCEVKPHDGHRENSLPRLMILILAMYRLSYSILTPYPLVANKILSVPDCTLSAEQHYARLTTVIKVLMLDASNGLVA